MHRFAPELNSRLSNGRGFRLNDPPDFRDVTPQQPAPLLSMVPRRPHTPACFGSVVTHQQHASFDECLAVVFPHHFVPNGRHIALIGHQRREQSWTKLDAAVLQRNS